MEEKTYAGLLSLEQYGEADDILFLSTIDVPFAEELQCLVDKRITLHYWISAEQMTKQQAQEEFLRALYGMLYGACDGKFVVHYSEITGYLWTDEELMVGGHDIIQELKSHIGKWLILEVRIH